VLEVGGTNQVPAGLDGGDCGENHVPSGLDGGNGGDGEGDGDGDGDSSSLSQMSAHRLAASPAAEPELTGDELPMSVLVGLPTSVDVKLLKPDDLKLELYSKHMSVYAR